MIAISRLQLIHMYNIESVTRFLDSIHDIILLLYNHMISIHGRKKGSLGRSALPGFKISPLFFFYVKTSYRVFGIFIGGMNFFWCYRFLKPISLCLTLVWEKPMVIGSQPEREKRKGKERNRARESKEMRSMFAVLSKSNWIHFCFRSVVICRPVFLTQRN